jgi:hypothetical protein
MPSLSRTWFTLIFCLSYIVFFALDWPLFLYYPQVKQLHLNAPAGDIGPSMHWYGLVASAAVAGTIAALLCKDSWFSMGLVKWLWVAPVAAMLGCSYFLRQFFM